VERLSGVCRRVGFAAVLLFAFRAAGEERLVLPGVARTSGVGGSRFTSTAWLHNPSDAPLTVELSLVSGSGASPEARIDLAPRQSRRLDDPILSLFGFDSAAGSLLARADRPFLLRGVTANVADPLGTYGLALASLRQAEALRPGETGIAAWLSHTVAGGTGFRTNVALTLLEAGSEAFVTVVDDTGLVRGEERVSSETPLFWQRSVTDLASDPQIPLGRVEVRVLCGAVVAYAAVVDNGTGDPVVLAPAAFPGGACATAAGTLTASATSVVAGGAVTVTLDAPGRGAGRLVPGDVPLAPGGSVALVPATTTTWRWLGDDACADGGPRPVTVEVVAPAGAVMTESGAVTGGAKGGITVFRGVPFAAPPTGALRFRPPAPAAPWSGARSVTSFGPVCPQLDDDGRVTGSEDCLTLSVWAPATRPAEPLPVLFFIHGGGNVQGASSVEFYDGTLFASKGRAVVVTVNYRLSTFGWLVQPFLSAESKRGVSGNYGTFDQLAALRWVKRNVAAFGGDPSRVTIFGESAGGVNVCSLVASPLGKGLFSGGIMQSGGCIEKSHAEFQAFGDTVTEAAGCSRAADPAACLRAVPFGELLLAVPPLVSVVSSTGQLWGPAVDGFVLHESPDLVLARGGQNKVPFVVGANADETGKAVPLISTEAEYRALVAAQYGGLAPYVLAKYPASAYDTPRDAYVAVTTDARFVCLSRRYARAAATGGSPKVFRYLFSYPANRLFGAIHGIEIPFVFGSFDAVPGLTPTPEAFVLADSMNAAWARFAATGDPNGPGLPAWPLYDAARDSSMIWDSPPSAVDGVRTPQCDFWDSIIDSTPR
jgi:para-nitrobenzyl esterase